MQNKKNYLLAAIFNLLAALCFATIGALKIAPGSDLHLYIWFIVAALFLVASLLNFKKYRSSHDGTITG